MEHECSSPWPQEPCSSSYPEPNQSSTYYSFYAAFKTFYIINLFDKVENCITIRHLLRNGRMEMWIYTSSMCDVNESASF